MMNKIKQCLNFIGSISKTAIKDGYVTNTELNEQLKQFHPNSAGSVRQLTTLTLQSAQQTFLRLAELLNTLDYPTIPLLNVDQLCDDDSSQSNAQQLAELFNKHGSDKSSMHNYHLIYGKILSGEHTDEINILEIGMGTNNSELVSNMGEQGKPGASLRAFRDFSANAQVYGADIDEDILFTEDRIQTFAVDQTSPDSLQRLASQLNATQFDLIIDDGLHTAHANIATLNFALNKLKVSGWFVCEDIHADSLPVWNVVAALIPNGYATYLYKTAGSHVLAIQKETPQQEKIA